MATPLLAKTPFNYATHITGLLSSYSKSSQVSIEWDSTAVPCTSQKVTVDARFQIDFRAWIFTMHARA